MQVVIDGERAFDLRSLTCIASATVANDLSERAWQLEQTGTREGVALSGRFLYLADGDRVEVGIDGTGSQRHRGGAIMSEFDDITAAVTGGGSGIGAAIAAELAALGARVAVLDLRPGTAHFGVECDVSDDGSVRAAIGKVVDAFGGLDVLVNNAGIGAAGAIDGNDETEWHRVWDINVVGIMRVPRAALPYLRASRTPAVVNTSSIAATAGAPQRALYSASKGAVSALTRAMAADYVREGIRVNAVSPGTADTPWIGRLLDAADDPEHERAQLAARQPHGRLIDPAEIAHAVAYLASPRASSTTGISLAVDGGIQELRLRQG